MKHGILMIAHNNASVVRTAMRMLDDSRFTFFLLVDAKSPLSPGDFIPPLVNSRCVVLKRTVINWAGYSQIQAELNLLGAAVEAGMEWLHFLQGADLPLKTPEAIDRFLSAHAGKNFIQIHPEKQAFAGYKAGYKHYFVDTPGYRTGKLRKGLRYGLVAIQKLYRKPAPGFYHSSALFSITAEFARYVLEREAAIRKQYQYSLAGDEVFLSTLFMTSPYASTLWKEGAGCRLIDWQRAEGNSPHTFGMEDRALLRAAMDQEDILFARKFSEQRDFEIVREVERLVMGQPDFPN